MVNPICNSQKASSEAGLSPLLLSFLAKTAFLGAYQRLSCSRSRMTRSAICCTSWNKGLIPYLISTLPISSTSGSGLTSIGRLS